MEGDPQWPPSISHTDPLTHTFTVTLLNHFICLCWTFWTFFKLTFNDVFTHIQPNIRWPTDMLLKCYKYSVNYVEVDYQKKRLISCSRTGHQFLLLYANKSLLALNWTRQWREAMESTGTLFLFQSCWILSVFCLYLWLWGQGQVFNQQFPTRCTTLELCHELTLCSSCVFILIK